MAIEDAFPSLREAGYRLTSPSSPTYNCIAWAAREESRWWWPDPRGFYYWPPSVPRTETVESFVRAFRTLGFAPCGKAAEPEAGFERIALYGDEGRVKHPARQLPDGKWTSKLGESVDIEHPLDALVGRLYGNVLVVMRRPRPALEGPAPLGDETTGLSS